MDLRRGSGPVLIPGAPGTGKTTVLVESAVARVERDGLDPERILILAPGRHAAAGLRNSFTGRLDRSLSTAPARTWASYAFDVLRRARAEGVLKLPRPPKLLSGPEQDLIIKELLEGHDHPGLELPWPKDLSAALPTRGFRQEVRELFDRITESGRTAQDLEWLSYECGRPDWLAAAALYAEYRDVLDLRMPEAFDPAGIITAARQLFQDAPDFLEAERERLQLILVDDIQEANPAVFELLADIAASRDVLITASPDTVVQGFRGARPDLVAELPRLLSSNGDRIRELPLTFSHRLGAAISEAWSGVAARISQRSGGRQARRLDAPPFSTALSTVQCRVEGHVLASSVHELRYVAQRILEAQLCDGRELGDIAVVVRNGGLLGELQRYLSAQGIPVRVPVADAAVRDEVAVRPLLEAFSVALDPTLLTPELAVSLLTSRIGGATAIELRRLRQSLRHEELLGGGGRSSDSLLVEALLQPAALATLGLEANSARRLSRMISAGTAAAAVPGANAETVLWSLWHASGLAGKWASVALDGGAAGLRADRDLDAMMALFHAAERFVDQLPGSGPEQFLEYLLNQELPMDTLAARAQLEEAVELMTPASAAGREWPMVIVAGLQEGVWPNTKLRGELLASTLYADAVEHGVEHAMQRGPQSRLRDIRYDELRSFSSAISRASEVLICTAVSSDDEQPSAFLDYVAPLDPGNPVRPYTPVERPMTLRALVAELRQHVQAESPSGQEGGSVASDAREAARILADLATAVPAVPGAHPDSWWGLAPLSTEAPVVPPGGTVNVSPSKVESLNKSPLDWFVQAAGGEAATDFARSLGTLVHAIAQDMPEASGSEYIAELVRRWPSLGMKENWEGKLDYQRAESMVRKLAQYVLLMRSEGRSLVGVEQDFSVVLPDVTVEGTPDAPEGGTRSAVLRGQVDRLEIDADGRLVIVDLKTGKRQPGKTELERHPQLGAYQAAVVSGAFVDAVPELAPGGAVLAQLGTKTKSPGIQKQEALDPEDNWAVDMVNEAARLMAGATFEARHDPAKSGHGGFGCRLPDVCPLCARGKQVTE